jgi:hypothetical protein
VATDTARPLHANLSTRDAGPGYNLNHTVQPLDVWSIVSIDSMRLGRLLL